VQSEALSRMGDLHQASNPAIVVRVGANEIGPVGDDVVDVQLVAADMLADQDRRLNDRAQLAVAEGRGAAILVWVLQPQVPGRVARPADLERVRPGVVLACRVKHEVHPVADRTSRLEDGGDLTPDGAIAPAVDLESRVAYVPAANSEFSKSGGAT